jgi:hypothetical protein
MSKKDVYRDSAGNLINYESVPACTFGEVLAVKIEGRIGRIESNLGDARIDIHKVGNDLDHIKSQVAGVCNLTRELTTEVRTYMDTIKKENMPGRLICLEKKVTVMEKVGKLFMAIFGFVVTAISTVISYFKFIKG